MDEHRRRLGWLLVVAAFWAAELTYLVLPIDLVPDFLPVVGWSDDLLSLLIASGVTAWSVARAVPPPEGRAALPGPAGRTLDYEPLSADEIARL